MTRQTLSGTRTPGRRGSPGPPLRPRQRPVTLFGSGSFPARGATSWGTLLPLSYRRDTVRPETPRTSPVFRSPLLTLARFASQETKGLDQVRRVPGPEASGTPPGFTPGAPAPRNRREAVSPPSQGLRPERTPVGESCRPLALTPPPLRKTVLRPRKRDNPATLSRLSWSHGRTPVPPTRRTLEVPNRPVVPLSAKPNLRTVSPR